MHSIEWAIAHNNKWLHRISDGHGMASKVKFHYYLCTGSGVCRHSSHELLMPSKIEVIFIVSNRLRSKFIELIHKNESKFTKTETTKHDNRLQSAHATNDDEKKAKWERLGSSYRSNNDEREFRPKWMFVEFKCYQQQVSFFAVFQQIIATRLACNSVKKKQKSRGRHHFTFA